MWFHCASVGEFNTAKELILEFKKDYFVVLTYFSPRAKAFLEKQKNYYNLLHPLPLDIPMLVKRFEKSINPKALIILEREFWPSLIKSTKVKKALINAYSKGGIFEKIISKEIDLVITRTQTDAEKFTSYGVRKVLSCGNLKFVISAQEKSVNVKSKGDFIVAGSTHEGEEELILKVFLRLKKNYENLRLILAPRHISRVPHIENLLRGLNYTLRSKESENWDILLVDTLGELFYLYSFAKVCIVGGTFVNIGGHNLLEPVYWKKPVIFGPYTQKVRDVEEFLIEQGIGFKVNNEAELYHLIKRFLEYSPDVSFDLKEYSKKIKDCYLEALKKFIET